MPAPWLSTFRKSDLWRGKTTDWWFKNHSGHTTYSCANLEPNVEHTQVNSLPIVAGPYHCQPVWIYITFIQHAADNKQSARDVYRNLPILHPPSKIHPLRIFRTSCHLLLTEKSVLHFYCYAMARPIAHMKIQTALLSHVMHWYTADYAVVYNFIEMVYCYSLL